MDFAIVAIVVLMVIYGLLLFFIIVQIFDWLDKNAGEDTAYLWLIGASIGGLWLGYLLYAWLYGLFH